MPDRCAEYALVRQGSERDVVAHIAVAQGARDDLLRAFDAIGVHASGDRDRFHRVVVSLSVADAKRLVDVIADRLVTPR